MRIDASDRRAGFTLIEALVALELTRALLSKFGGDSFEMLAAALADYRTRLEHL